MARVSSVTAFAIFTFCGLSPLAIISWFYGFLPWFVWALTFLSTVVLAQMFVIRFAGKAHERLLAEVKAKLKPGLVIDHRNKEAVFVQA